MNLVILDSPFPIQCFETLSSKQCQDIENLEKKVFTNTYRPGHFSKEAPKKNNLLALLSTSNNQLVAYKVGYEIDSETFYSWVGGVHPQYRQQGLAKKLMQYQHQVLKEKGYKKVRTKTRMGFRAMLVLNIKAGFDISGLSTKPHVTDLIIEMKKNLND